MFLKRELLMGIFEAGFEKPSPIQEEAIPVALAKRDILARAKNGTGKTAAFVIPSLQQIDLTRNKIQALLLVPTRELATQVTDALAPLGKALGRTVAAVYGGANLEKQVQRLKDGADIVIATPGRMIDLLERGDVDLGNLEAFVLDEADNMLDQDGLGEQTLRVKKYACSNALTPRTHLP